jgi:hypothetical protein
MAAIPALAQDRSMRNQRLGKRGLVLFAIAVVAGAVVAVPAASARSGAGVSLSVLPLRASELGPAARGLTLELSSGVIRNTNPYAYEPSLFPNRSSGPIVFFPSSQQRLAELGRVSGYALDYGHGESGGAGITEVWTSVDAYKTSADAARGLAFRREVELQRAPPTNSFLGFNSDPLSATASREKAAAVGTRRFAVFVVYSAANLAPLFGLDEQFTVGRYEADVTVWAGSAGAAETLAPTLAKKLNARIRQALDGALWAKPVKLPPKAGDRGIEDLTPLGLRTTDLNGQASVIFRGYRSKPGFPFRFYAVSMAPAGQFQSIEQDIVWYPTANAATFNDDLARDWWGWGTWGGFGLTNLTGAGGGAWAVQEDYGPPSTLLGIVSGRVGESVSLGDPGFLIQVPQADNLAQIIANYITASGYGS